MPQDNALHKAANKGDLDECKKWVEEPPEGEDKIEVDELGANDRTAMHRAAGGGFMEIVEYLISKGGNISKADKSGRTPLHWAAIAGHVEVTEYLVGKGADITAETKSKMNILHCACEAQKVEMVRFIMAHVKGNDELKEKMTGAKNSDDKIPFDLAVASKNKDIIGALKEGGDVHASGACIIS